MHIYGDCSTVYHQIWWARLDSNQRPSDYESPSLTAELRALQCQVLQCHVPCLLRRTLDTGALTIERATGFEPADISLEG